MSTEKSLFTFGQIAFDVVVTVLNELLAADHGPASVCVSMALPKPGYRNYYQMNRSGKNNFRYPRRKSMSGHVLLPPTQTFPAPVLDTAQIFEGNAAGDGESQERPRVSATLFTLSRVPPVPAATAAAVGAMSLQRQRLFEPREILISPFGRVTLRCLEIGVPTPLRKDCEAWNVFWVRGSEPPGALVLDGLTALRLANASIGLPSPRTFRSLGQTERGIAASTLAALARRFSNELVLSLDRPGRMRLDLARLTISMEFEGFREYLHLLLPPAWFAEGGPPTSARNRSIADEACRRGLEIPLTIEAGRTCLTASAWAQAALGDAVLFDEIPYPSCGEPLPVRIWCGDWMAGAQWSSSGSLTVRSRFENIVASGILDPPRPPPSTQQRESMPTISEGSSSRGQDIIAAAPIEITAEIGRLVLPAEEVLALGPGSVLGLGPLQPQSVQLRIGSRIWARGELVDVEGQLGVRLTSLTRSETE